MVCKSVFVTATGTDVGKTYVSALIVKKMREMKLNCGYYKPVLSGAIRQNDSTFLPGDCDFVVKTSGLNVNPEACVTYCFEEAVSPHLAAMRAGIKIDKDVIKNEFLKRTAKYDYLVVEGAGGITCPFDLENDVLLLSDIIQYLNQDVLLVADGGLGTINSVLLTVDYAKNCGINICGIILNNYDKNDFMHLDNKRQIERLTGIRVLAEVAKGDKTLDVQKDELLKIFS